MSAQTRETAARSVRQVGLVAAAAVLIVAAGFASEYALAAHFIVGSPTYDTLPGILVYVTAIVALAAVVGAVGLEVGRGSQNRGLAGWLIGVSAAGTLFFGLLSILGAQFFAASSSADRLDTVATGLEYFASFAGPAVASLVAAITIFSRGSRLGSAWLPSVLVLTVVTASVIIVASV